MKSRTYTTTSTWYFTAVLASLVGFVILYMYFLSMSVVHVVLRQEAAYQIAALESEIALLESAYIESQHVVSTHMARLAQFSETGEKVFVTRTSPTLVYSE